MEKFILSVFFAAIAKNTPNTLSKIQPKLGMSVPEIQKKKLCFKPLFLFAVLFLYSYTGALAQTPVFPSASSCTSKDLLLVNATMPSSPCETCTLGTPVTKQLTLYINNKTGSTRTSFAFWATLRVINSDGTIDVANSTHISSCFSPIPKNATTAFVYGNITYRCGQTLQLVDIWEAWTDASPNSTCSTLLGNTATINPKCGIVDELNVIAGLDAMLTVTAANCSNSGGSIVVRPQGGTGPYTVTLVGSPNIVRTGVTTSTTFSNLASGSYTVTLSDANNCPTPVTKTPIVGSTNTSPLPVVTTPVVYCQNSTASALSATGDNLKWYTTATGGTGSSTAPTSSTASAGSTSYWVTQTTSNYCESARAQIVVIVNATSGMPGVSTPIVYCQNATASVLSATGENLKWYTAATGGTASATAPTPSTATAGTISYWVSQTVTANGVACESSRAHINVIVNATPAAPSVISPVVYCQNATASVLSTTGENLKWYTAATGGTASATAPTPSTSTAGTSSYYVSQTLTSNGISCESARAQIMVTVNATPGAPGVTSPVSYCQNTTASALSATGENLKWYTAATGGTSSATAPTPSTSTAGTSSYYVSQTLTSNGISCESASAQIMVTVNATPGAPSIFITQPSLCVATGSIKVCNPTEGYTYALAGMSQSGIVANGQEIVFGNLAAGSSPTVIATSSSGCNSSTADCNSSVTECPPQINARVANTTPSQDAQTSPTETTLTPEKNEVTEKLLSNSFDVYPVPFKEQFTVKYHFDYSSKVKIEVFTIFGALVLTKEDSNGYPGKEYLLYMSKKEFANQIYFVRVTTDRNSVSKKIISTKD